MDISTIGINGLFLRKPGTGIGEVTLFFLRTLAAANTKEVSPATILIFTDERVALADEELPGITFVVLRPWWQRDDLIRKFLWEYIQLPLAVQKYKLQQFISLYQCVTVLPKIVRHTMVVHDMIPERFPAYRGNWRQKIHWSLTKRAICKAGAVVAVSQATKNDIVELLLLPPENITVAYPSINPLFFMEHSQEYESDTLSKYQLMPGYLYAGGGFEIRKNIDGLLRVYKFWKEATENVPTLVLSGKLHGSKNTLATHVTELIKELGLTDSVKLLGFVPTEDLPALYAGARLFVFPSLYEGFGMPVLEALSQGTATLTLDNSSLKEVGGAVTTHVKALTRESLEAAFAASAQESLGVRAARKLFAKQFRWEQFTKEVMGYNTKKG
jgi:glycosyltransferase involved in cell wall biosynthesis